MGFFFATQVKKKAAKQQRVAAPNKQAKESLARFGCKACVLNKADVLSPKMEPLFGKAEGEIYFIGEAPDTIDDDKNEPLSGWAGDMVRQEFPDGEEEYCSFDNVINCMPKGRPGWNEISCCQARRISYIEDIKPKLIVGLGFTPLQWMLNSVDMNGLRGRVFAVKIGKHECWFMPTFHPDWIKSRAFNKDKPLQSRDGHAFRMDIRKAFRLVKTLPKAKVDTEADARANIQAFEGGDADLGAVLKLIQQARKAQLKAIDLETSHLRPYAANAKILTAAVSFDNVNFAFAVDHPKRKWTEPQRKILLEAFKELLIDDTTKIAHNTPFELEWLMHYYGEQILSHETWECTMTQAHVLDVRKGKEGRGDGDDSESEKKAVYQKLGFLTKMYFGIEYKGFFKLNKKDMSKADLGETLIYNGADTKYTLRLFFHQEKLIKDEGMHHAYVDRIPRQVSVANMQRIGVLVGQKTVDKFQKRYKAEIEGGKDDLGNEHEGILNQIKNLKVVKAFEKDRGEYKPLSGQDLLILLKDYLKIPEIIKADKEGKAKLDKNILINIDHPIAGLTIKLRNVSKMKSTYVDPFKLGKGHFIWPDGRIHTNFNTTFTETARLSSDEPNQQNWPKRTGGAEREQVQADPGHVLLAFDYAQLEGCGAAVCSRDKLLTQFIWDDYDMHMEWAQKLAHKYPAVIGGKQAIADKKIMKGFRSLVKNKLVFPAVFGAANESIHGYLVNSTEVDIPEWVVDELMDEFWGTFTGLADWQKNLMKDFYEQGWVASPQGSRRYYPLSRNEAINHPIQCFGAEVVCESMNTLSAKALKEQRPEIHPVLNIHDDLTFLVPDKNSVIEDAIDTIYRIMITPPYSCINVPMGVECSIGKNWAPYDKHKNPDGMQEVRKFFSHKDL